MRPNFQLTQDNLEAITQICRLVDGSPLGIVLAGAWLELLPPKEIVDEINHSMDFLESSAADIPERQRSLRAVFNSSWKLLSKDEQQAFRRMCVFQGSFSRHAAQVVSGCSIRTLLSLANKSWLLQAGEGRYLLHDVMRQFGMEHLHADQNEWQETKDRHADYFSTYLQVQGQALRTAGQIQALEALKTELESNIPDAWEWFVEHQRFDFLIDRMLPGLFHYWLIRFGSMEFISMLKRARKAVPNSNEQQGLLQQAILETVESNFEINGLIFDDLPKERLQQLWIRVQESGLEGEMGMWYLVLITTYGNTLNYEEASRRVQEMIPKIKTFQDAWEKGYGYYLAGRFSVSDTPEIHKKYLLEALRIFQKIGVIDEQGGTLLGLAQLAANGLDYELAIDYNQKAKQFLEQVGDEWGVDSVWNSLGEYSIYLGKIDQAFQAYRELRYFSEKIGNRRMLGTNYSWESLQASRYGSLDCALELRYKSLEIAMEVENQNDIAYHNWELGEIYRLMGDLEQARKYYEAALPLFEKLQDHIGIGFYHRGCGELAISQGNWVEARDEYQEALANHEKEQRSLWKWGLAFYHARLGTILTQLGEIGEAKENLRTSLGLAEELAHPDMKALPLMGIANLLATTGHPDQAIEIMACVIRQPTTWNEVKQQASRIMQAAMEALPVDEAMRWKERGEAKRIDELSKELMVNPDIFDGQ